MKFLMVIFVCLATLSISKAENDARASVQVIMHPDKNEYAAAVPGSDKHKYGYELKENKYFHHTTTEDDGVRLGCYGHVLDGKKYSTQYVADSRGYRPVFTYDPITVYPKNGPERKASFVGDFSEAEEQSLNIRYFFPDGCKGFEIKQSSPSANVIIFKQPDPPVTPPRQVTTPKKVITTPFKTPTTTTTRRPNQPIVLLSTPIPTPKVTVRPKPTPPATPPATPPPVIPQRSPLNPPTTDDSCKADSCCDDHKPKLVLPVPLKSGGGGSSCGSFGKLVVPVEGLDADLLRSLSKGGDSKALIKSILQNLA